MIVRSSVLALGIASALVVVAVTPGCPPGACSADSDCGAGAFCHVRADGTLQCGQACGDFIECDPGILCSDGRCVDRAPVTGEGEGEGEGEVLPTVQGFATTAPLVRIGESVTLTWSVTGAVGLCRVTRTFDGRVIDDDDSDHAITDAPFADTDYELRCAGSVSGTLVVSVDVSLVLVSQDEADRVVAVGESVVARVTPGPHTQAPCTVNGQTADGSGDVTLTIADGDGDGALAVVGSCATEGGGPVTSASLELVVLFDVAVTGAAAGNPGSVIIDALPGATCTVNGAAATPGVAVATPATPTTVTVACARSEGDASIDVAVPAI